MQIPYEGRAVCACGCGMGETPEPGFREYKKQCSTC